MSKKTTIPVRQRNSICGLPATRRAIILVVMLVGSTQRATVGADYLIHISVDGLRPSYLQAEINNGNAPNFERFQDEGAWTINARTDYTHTITLPNHISMVTGRPVLQPAGMPDTVHHGYTSNSDPPSTWTLHNQGPDVYKASTFDVVHDAGLSTALYASKSKFSIFDQSYDATTGAEHPNGRDKIDTFFAQQNSSSIMQSQLLADIALNHFNYAFIHYADPDIAGHAYGWGSANYLNAVHTVDGYLGTVFDLIENDATLAGRTAIVLSADHGGTGTGHSDPSLVQDYTIPFFAWGAGVGHGDLYAFNADSRTDPGTGRPDYNAVGQPIRNGDSGNLALTLLGLGPIPNSLINAAQNLHVTAPGDFNADNVVDAADYVVWRSEIGTAAEYDLWRAHFGQSTAGGAATESSTAAAVPEPAGLPLLLAAALAMYLSRSHSWQRRSKPGPQKSTKVVASCYNRLLAIE
jgi:hypothetical protein